jgi:hypothetical protein
MVGKFWFLGVQQLVIFKTNVKGRTVEPVSKSVSKNPSKLKVLQLKFYASLIKISSKTSDPTRWMVGKPDWARFIAWSAKVLYPKWVDMPLKRSLKVFVRGIGINLDVDN